jgi:predicted permease
MIPVILAKQFGGNPGLAMQVCLITTFVSFLTLPLWMAIGTHFVIGF